MKTFAVKDRKSASSSRVKQGSVHSPATAHLRMQQAVIHQIVQPKVKIGQPNDRFEQEADQVAKRVVANQPVTDISSVSKNLTHPVSQAIQTASEGDDAIWESEVEPRIEEEEDGSLKTRLLQRQIEQGEEETVQTKLLQRQAEEEEEEEEETLQTKLLQRQVEEEEEETEAVQAKGAIPPVQSVAHAVNAQSPGLPLRQDVKTKLETGMGADLSGVRVHEDSAAHEAAALINARAFTHRNDIWLGKGQSQSDLGLMAHEATHVVQQRGGLRKSLPEISSAAPRIQPLWNPVSAITNAVSSAAEWVGDSIGEAVDYIKERAVEFVSGMPGYSLFTVVYGSDPITGRRVERNGRNFIEAGLDVIPNGEALKQKLEEEGALEEAARWLDTELMELDFSPTVIASQFTRFWDSLTLADATRLSSVMRRLADIILEPLGRIRRFAVNVAKRLLQIVKDYVISSLINFIREHTNAYPLLTVILGRDPISNEVVERTPMALLRGFMQLSESGQEQLRQMEESGSLQRAADWLNGAVERLNISWELIRESFTRAWDLITIQNLLNPTAVFLELYHIFSGPVGRIVGFLVEVAVKVLGFIKDALINRLVDYALTVRGYPLIAVILGKDPFSQEPVERNTANIIRGFMSLMENGEQQYREMEQSGAIARMSARVEAAMAVLNFTWEYIRGLFTRAWNSFSLQDMAVPLEAFLRLMNIFAGPILRLINFVGEIIKIVIEVVMEVMNFPIDLIRNIITRAMQAIEDIKRDPAGFLKNMIRAVKTGFQQFFGNILRHLLHGLTGWLFGELRDANINPPADLSFRSILGFVLEVLDITVERIWQKLAERIGEERVARIRGMIDRLTGIWTFVRDVATRGPVAIWEYIQERLSNLWNTVLEAIRNWVVTRIIERVTVRLLSMLDPTGIMAVVNGFIAFYNAVQSFIRYLREMLGIVNSFVVGVAELARGNVTIAANFLENSLSQAMPVAIGFLANQVGLSGIGRRIGEMIERVRAMVDQALTWLVDRAVSAGSALLNVGRSAVASIVNWWQTRKRFTNVRGEEHTLYFEEQGRNIRLMIRSTAQYYSAYLSSIDVPADKAAAKAAATAKASEIDVVLRQSSEQNSPDPTVLSTKLDELAVLTADLDLPSAGSFNPSYGSTTSEGFGSSVHVSTLSQNDNGSHVNQGYVNSNNAFRTLKARRLGGTSYYIAGHLLNNNLGGPGNEWRNLTPLTQYANTQDHEPGFERFVKDAVNNNRKTVDFIVSARYGPHSGLQLGKANDLRASGDTVLADVVEAEAKVPTALDCSAVEVSPTRGNLISRHTVSNSIDTDLRNYDLEGIPAQKVYLLEMSKEELMTLDGIDGQVAESILAAKQNNTIRRWRTLQSLVPGINTDTIRATSGKNVLLFKV